MTNAFIKASVTAYAILGVALLLRNTVLDGSREVNAHGYHMAEVYVKWDCRDFPEHCQEAKDRMRALLKDGKLTDDELYSEYLRWSLSLPKNSTVQELQRFLNE